MMLGAIQFASAAPGGTKGPDIYWGVDSVTHADDDSGQGIKFFERVKAYAGKPPDFWGRYIGSPPPNENNNLSLTERNFLLRDRNCRILLIYNGHAGSTPLDSPDGVVAANTAIARARALGAPEDPPRSVWIYCDIEPGQPVTSGFFTSWFTKMLSDSGYGAGIYGPPGTSWDARPGPPAIPAGSFDAQFCGAYQPSNPPKYFYTTVPQPLVGQCRLDSRDFAPRRPSPCTPPTVIQQYDIGPVVVLPDGRPARNGCPVPGAMPGQNVDLDLAIQDGLNSMWAPVKSELFLIRSSTLPVVFDGFDRSPGSGRLHAFCHDSGGTLGQFFHYYSDTDGQQWTLNSTFNLPIAPYPTAGCVGWPPPRVDGGPQLQQQLQTYQQANPGHQVDICIDTFEVVTTSGCEAFNYAKDVAFAVSADGRVHAFYHQYHSRREATVRWTYATGYLCDRFYASESTCTHCGNPMGRQVGTPVPNMLQSTTGTDTLFQVDQYMLHSKTATDGVTWDGSMDIIDETHFDRLNGVGDDGLVYGDFEVRCDDNSVPYFAWSYDGFRRSPGTANSEEAVYFRKGATGAKETVDIQSGNSTNYRRVMPHVAPDIATGKTLVMWRAVTSGQFPASPDHLYYKVRSNAGAFGPRQTFFDDTGAETTDTLKLHPTGTGWIKMVHSIATGSGSTLTYNLYKADFNFVTEGFGVRTRFYQNNVGTNGLLWYGSSLDGSKTRLMILLSTLVYTPPPNPTGRYTTYLFADAVSGGKPRWMSPAPPGDFRLVMRSFSHGVNINFIDGTLQNDPARYVFGVFYSPPTGTTALYLGRS